MGLELLLSLCWHVVLGEVCALRSITPFLTKLLVFSILQSRNGSLIAGCLSPRGACPLYPDLSWLWLTQPWCRSLGFPPSFELSPGISASAARAGGQLGLSYYLLGKCTEALGSCRDTSLRPCSDQEPASPHGRGRGLGRGAAMAGHWAVLSLSLSLACEGSHLALA